MDSFLPSPGNATRGNGLLSCIQLILHFVKHNFCFVPPGEFQETHSSPRRDDTLEDHSNCILSYPFLGVFNSSVERSPLSIAKDIQCDSINNSLYCRLLFTKAS